MSGKKRDGWGSRIGFIMAAAGSAVGLGNIWRFPYLAGTNGGGAFILIYAVFAICIGLSLMIAEFAIGRRYQMGPAGAFKKMGKRWTFGGTIGVATAVLIMGFYPVVGGWSLAYIFKSVSGLLSDTAAIGDVFGSFIGNPVQPLIWMAIYLVINVVIVVKGISGGIESASKVMMPTLLILMILLAIRSATLSGASAGIDFLFKPDFSEVTWGTYLSALGQAFFSLSLGMGIMVTYGSYLPKENSIPRNSTIITVLDTTVALLAGVAIFPAAFHYGIEPTAGPGLVFVVVPTIFSKMGGIGTVFSVLFFIAFSIAAISSSISLLEVVVTYLIEIKNFTRKRAVILSSIVMGVLCILASLSLGLFSEFKFLGVGFFDLFDKITDKVFLSIGGLVVALCIGWHMNKEDIKNELTNDGTISFKLFDVWYFLVKYIVPLAVGCIAIFGIKDEPAKEVMLLSIGLILIMRYEGIIGGFEDEITAIKDRK